MQTAPSPARLIALAHGIRLQTLRASLRFRERFVVLGDRLLVGVLGAGVAQDHALERVGDDLMERRLDDRVVHLPAARLDEIRPGALVASLWGRKIWSVVRGSAGNDFTALRSNRLRGRRGHELHELPGRFLLLGEAIDRELEAVHGLALVRRESGRRGPREIVSGTLGLNRAITIQAERGHRDGDGA